MVAAVNQQSPRRHSFSGIDDRRDRAFRRTNRSVRRPTWSPGLRLAFFLILLAFAGSLAGFKPVGISRDLDNYRGLFEWAAQADWHELLAANDPIYHVASRLVWMLGGGFTTFMLVIALTTCAAKATVLRGLDAERGVLVLLYFSYLFWLHEYTQIRLALALGLVMLAIYRPSRVSWILYVVAVLVHGSTVLIVALHMAIHHRRAAIISIATSFAALLLTSHAEDFYLALISRVSVYIDLLDIGEFTKINIFSLMPLLQGVILIVSIRHLSKLPLIAQEEFIVSCVGFASFYLLSFLPVLAFRTHELLIPFFLIFISRMWRHSRLVKLGSIMYMLVGIRITFFSADSLLFTGAPR